MKPLTIAQMTVRVAGVLLLVIGLVIWTGHGDQIIPLHELLGFVLVLGLWTIAFLAARAGVARGLVARAVVWGLIAPALGLTQVNLLSGDAHWVIEVIHLLVGVGAIGIAELLAHEIKTSTKVPAAA